MRISISVDSMKQDACVSVETDVARLTAVLNWFTCKGMCTFVRGSTHKKNILNKLRTSRASPSVEFVRKSSTSDSNALSAARSSLNDISSS